MVAWVGLRGAAPIILATFPMLAGEPQAATIFNVVFFTVLTSVLLQGTSLPLVARWLGVDAPLVATARFPLDFEPRGRTNSALVDIAIPHHAVAVGRRIMELGLPPGTLIVLLSRDDEYVVPSGQTVLESGDTLLVLAAKHDLAVVRGLLAAPVSSEPHTT
jgi:cell volume regulation protein A